MSVSYPPINYVLARLYRQACLRPPPTPARTHTHSTSKNQAWTSCSVSFFLFAASAIALILSSGSRRIVHCIAALLLRRELKIHTVETSPSHHRIIELTVPFYDSTSALTSFFSGCNCETLAPWTPLDHLHSMFQTSHPLFKSVNKHKPYVDIWER